MAKVLDSQTASIMAGMDYDQKNAPYYCTKCHRPSYAPKGKNKDICSFCGKRGIIENVRRR